MQARVSTKHNRAAELQNTNLSYTGRGFLCGLNCVSGADLSSPTAYHSPIFVFGVLLRPCKPHA